MSNDYQIDRVYRISHRRKGSFTAHITCISDEWVTGTLLSEEPKRVGGLQGYAETGDALTFRESFTTILEDVTDALLSEREKGE